MGKFFRFYVVGIPAACAFAANLINLPKNWGAIMSFMPWIAEDIPRTVLGAALLCVCIWAFWPWLRNATEKERPTRKFVQIMGNISDVTIEKNITDADVVLDLGGKGEKIKISENTHLAPKNITKIIKD